MIAVLPWLLVVEALALAGLPLTMRVFRGFPDRGFGLGRALSIVLVGMACWLTGIAGLTEYRSVTVVAVALALALLAWSLWGRACVATVTERWRLLLLMEGAFLLLLGLGVLVRSYNADIIGQEKFMDFAFMHALLRATELPAEDMWLSGFGMPYYYVSYLLAGLPAKVAGTHPPVAYNLAMAFVFAGGFASAASIVYALVARGRDAAISGQAFAFALLGGTLIMIVGNLVGPLELLAAAGWGGPDFWQAVGVKGLAASPSGGMLPADGGWWWRSSRVIATIQPDGITEFPYFSFILGDLHPHYVAILLDLLVVGLALAPWLEDEEGADWVRGGVASVVLAALVVASTWDVPTFWGLFVFAGLADAWRRQPDPRALRARARPILAPAVAAFVVVAPYFVGYQSQRLGIGIVDVRTPLVSMVIIFGPALAAAAAYGVWLVRRPSCAGVPSPPAPLPRVGEGSTMRSLPHSLAPRVLGAMGLLVLVLSAFGEPTLALLGVLALLLGWAGWRVLGQGQVATHSVAAQAMFVWLLMAYALVVVIGVEWIFLRDVFGSRMNTVFKFHYHVWIMLGLASAAALGTLWRGPEEVRSPQRETGAASSPSRDPEPSPVSRAWRLVAGTLVACMLAGGLVYPLAATWTKSGEFRGQPTLDGEQFLERGSPADHRAIEWLRSSATGRPVVVEAIGGSYQEFARVSTFSGLPTVAGWIGHELQWRGERPEYRQREQDVDAIYRGTEREAILDLGRRYNAHYVFFGSLERTKYGAESQSRLDTLLPVAYSRGGTTIYSLTGREDGAP